MKHDSGRLPGSFLDSRPRVFFVWHPGVGTSEPFLRAFARCSEGVTMNVSDD